MQRAKVNGVELEYRIEGKGEPVLLISPVIAGAFLPFTTQPALAERYMLVRYHKRGWAGSTHSPPPVSMADHAADAAALLEHLGIPLAHVVGHSSGAAVALQLAAERPGLVRALVLLEPPLLSIPAGQAFLEKAGPAFDAYGAGNAERAIALFLSAVSGLRWEECRATIERHVPGAVAQAVSDADTFFSVELPALADWTFGPEQAANLPLPVLLVEGSDTEPLFRESAELLRSAFPRPEGCLVEGTGHLLQLQDPGAVAECIAAFLDRHRITDDVVASAAVRSGSEH